MSDRAMYYRQDTGETVGEELAREWAEEEWDRDWSKVERTCVPPYANWVCRLMRAIQSDSISRIQAAEALVKDEMEALPLCEWDGDKCGNFATEIVVGIACCPDHAKVRADIFRPDGYKLSHE